MSKQLYGTCCLLVEIAAFTSWTASGVGCKRTLRAFSQNGLRAEGYAAGELKHGPIALIDETMPVIVIAPCDRVFDKTVSNMQEVAARGGRLILVDRFRESYHKRGIHLSFQTPICAVRGALSERIGPKWQRGGERLNCRSKIRMWRD
jgi:hypothetical protein